MPRLNIERQKELEPKRIAYAQGQINALGYSTVIIKDGCIQFSFKGETVKFFAYSGWATGKTIKDCRGLKNLLNQLKQSS